MQTQAGLDQMELNYTSMTETYMYQHSGRRCTYGEKRHCREQKKPRLMQMLSVSGDALPRALAVPPPVAAAIDGAAAAEEGEPRLARQQEPVPGFCVFVYVGRLGFRDLSLTVISRNSREYAQITLKHI